MVRSGKRSGNSPQSGIASPLEMRSQSLHEQYDAVDEEQVVQVGSALSDPGGSGNINGQGRKGLQTCRVNIFVAESRHACASEGSNYFQSICAHYKFANNFSY